jgi:CO/xanthine dehydrogenase Mo-binding subunit
MSTTRFVINGSDLAVAATPETTLIAPAIANAFARLTGKRLRSLPMPAEQVLQALRA